MEKKIDYDWLQDHLDFTQCDKIECDRYIECFCDPDHCPLWARLEDVPDEIVCIDGRYSLRPAGKKDTPPTDSSEEAGTKTTGLEINTSYDAYERLLDEETDETQTPDEPEKGPKKEPHEKD